MVVTQAERVGVGGGAGREGGAGNREEEEAMQGRGAEKRAGSLGRE